MPVLLVIILSLLFSGSVRADFLTDVKLACISLLPGNRNPVATQALADQNLWQEVNWSLRESYENAKADELEAQLTKILLGPHLNYVKIKEPNIYLVTFEGGFQGIFKHAVNKIRNHHAEVRAYLLDKAHHNKFHVPVTVYRELDGMQGSMQLFVPGLVQEAEFISEELIAFDLVIGNADRFAKHNYGQTAAGRFVAYDNDAAIYLAGINLHEPLYSIEYWVSRRCAGIDDEQPLEWQLRACLKKHSVNLWKFRAAVWNMHPHLMHNALKGELPEEHIEQMLENLHFLRRI